MKALEKKKKILIIGDIMLDRYLFGTVTRISPEAPVPVLDYLETENRLGGAANVALNLLNYEAEVHLIALVGKDEEGDILNELLNTNQISSQYLLCSEGRRTTLKTRVMASNHQLLRVDREDKGSLTQEDEKMILEAISSCLSEIKPDGIILQDYNKGLLSPLVIKTAVTLANRQGIPIFVDPKINNVSCYSNCTVFKPNLKEAEAIIGEKIEVSLEGLETATEKLQAIINHELTIITLSDKGLYIKSKDSHSYYIDAIKQKVSDVCGAGDTVISTVAVGYLSGYNVEELGRISNLAGHIVCRFPGVVPIDINMLKSEMRHI